MRNFFLGLLLGLSAALVFSASAANYAGDANPEWNDTKVCPPGTGNVYWGALKDGNTWKPIYRCETGISETYRNETQSPSSPIVTSGVI